MGKSWSHHTPFTQHQDHHWGENTVWVLLSPYTYTCLPIRLLSFCWGYRLSSKSLRSFSTFTRRKIASWFPGPSLPFHAGRQANSFGWLLKPRLAFRTIGRGYSRGPERQRENRAKVYASQRVKAQTPQNPSACLSHACKGGGAFPRPILQLPISRQSRMVVWEPCPMWSALHTCELSLNRTQCGTQHKSRSE